jgi:hypothetical protein
MSPKLCLRHGHHFVAVDSCAIHAHMCLLLFLVPKPTCQTQITLLPFVPCLCETCLVTMPACLPACLPSQSCSQALSSPSVSYITMLQNITLQPDTFGHNKPLLVNRPVDVQVGCFFVLMCHVTTAASVAWNRRSHVGCGGLHTHFLFFGSATLHPHIHCLCTAHCTQSAYQCF